MLELPISEIKYFTDAQVERQMEIIKNAKVCFCGSRFKPDSMTITKAHLMTDMHQISIMKGIAPYP